MNAMIKKVNILLMVFALFIQLIPLHMVDATTGTEADGKVNGVVFSDNIGEEVKLLEEKDANSDVLVHIPDDSKVIVEEIGDEYAKVTYEGTDSEQVWTGFLDQNYLVDEAEAEQIRTSREQQTIDQEKSADELSSTESVEGQEIDEDKESTVTKESPIEGEAGEESPETNDTSSEDTSVSSDEADLSTEEKAAEDKVVEGNEEEETIETESSSNELPGEENPDKEEKNVKAQEESSTDEQVSIAGMEKKSLTMTSVETTQTYHGVALKAPTNVYAEISTGSKVLKSYAQGSVLKYSGFSNANWNVATVYINGTPTTGYINKGDVENLVDSQTTLHGVAQADPTNIYSKASTNSNVWKSYNKGSVLKYKTFSSGWYEATVYAEGSYRTGYIKASDVSNGDSSSTTLYGIGLQSPTKVYREAATSSSAWKSYAEGTVLKYETFTTGWHKATVYASGEYRTGYIKTDHVENIDADPTTLRGVGMNSPTPIYAKASTSADILKSYSQGTVLKYETFTSGWYKATVYVNGKKTGGYINANHVQNGDKDQTVIYGIGLKSPTNIYSDVTTSSNVIKTYGQGTVLKYETFISGWYEATVYVNGKRRHGYINASDTENSVANPTTLSGIGIKAPTNIYADATTNSEVLKTYGQGTVLKYQTFTTNWYQAVVYSNGKWRNGYIYKEDVESGDPSPTSLKGIGLADPTNVYSQATLSSEVLKAFKQGEILAYQSFTEDWYEITVDINGSSKTGYIHNTHVQGLTDETSTFQVRALDKVNVHDLASRKSNVLKSYEKDSILKVYTFTEDWYKVKVSINGKYVTGYIAESDVTTNLEPEPDKTYIDTDLRKPSNVTAQEIVDYFNRTRPESPLKDLAQDFIDVQNEYGVNAVYLVAHTIWETGWGGSNLMDYKNNLYGYGAYDVCPFTCGYYYPTEAESINSVAYMVRTNYLNPDGRYYNGPTLIGMNVRYATDQNWKNGIARLMESIRPYDAKHYSSASILPMNGSSPGTYGRNIPESQPYPEDVIINFPEGITATLLENSNYRTLPYTSSSTYVGTLTQSSEVTIIGYNEDVRENGSYPYDNRWYRVLVDGRTVWVYGKSLAMNNLIQVNEDVSPRLNIRNAPNGDIVGKTYPGDFLKAVLEEGQFIVKDEYVKIQLPDSNEAGWVHQDFVHIIIN